MMNIVIATIATIFSLGLALLISNNSVDIFQSIKAHQLLIAIAFLVQWFMYIPSLILRSEKFYDLTGSMTYILIIALGIYFANINDLVDLPKTIIAVCVCMWALRLGSFLFLRVHKAGGDKRFKDILRSPSQLFMTWSLQGLWVSICSSAALVAITNTEMKELSLFFYSGFCMYLVGLAVEVIADRQKTLFNSIPENKDRFINTGLWSRSRHPNYFGEILLWLGITVMSVPYMKGLAFLSLIAPIFTYFLLNNISGIRMLDNKARKKWGKLKEYQEYRKNTPKLIPKMFK